MRYHLTLICFSLISFSQLNVVQAQQWSRFRGPNGSGVSKTKLPIEWTDSHRQWKIQLPGKGHSSPVIWDQKLFVTCGNDEKQDRYLLCINATDGKQLWRKTFAGRKTRKHRDNSLTTSTPALDSERVYVSWADSQGGTVHALTHAGKSIWEFTLPPFKTGHGYGPSPIIDGQLLIVPHDQGGNGSLYALDRRTGKVRWKVERKGKASWTTPVVYRDQNQQDQLIFTNYEHGVTAINPENGKVLWEADVFDKGHLESAIASPVVSDDLIFATCGWMGVRQEVIALSSTRTKPKFVIDRSAPLCVTPLVREDLLFLWSDHGIVSCIDIKTGQRHWRQRVPGTYYSSPVCAGDALYNVSRQGEVIVLSASKNYKQLARHDIGEGSHSTPAIANGRLYIQTFSSLMCIGYK